jgi:predicted FMN-binding regulatory protein PaiB
VYVPRYFRESGESEIEKFIENNSFATLVRSTEEGEILASHIPLDLDRSPEGSVLTGLLAKANPLWREFSASKEVLAIFQGPHAIVGFRIPISRTTAYYKLSQNRHETDHANVVRQLEAEGDARSCEVAEFMKRAGGQKSLRKERP